MSAALLRWAVALLALALVSVTSGCVEPRDPTTGPDGPGSDVESSTDAGTPEPDTTDSGPGDAGPEDVDSGDSSDTGPDVDDDNGGTDNGWGCAPDVDFDDERYVDFEDLDGQELVDELAQKVSDHDAQGYNAARTFMFDTLEVRDDGKLECVYTHDRVEPDGTNLPGDQFNTEHTWPQSRGADTEPARSDVHHLFPADQEANKRRAHYEFGHVGCSESTCEWHRDGSFLGPSNDDWRDPIFEVRPDRRGDIARAILYFSVRYDEPVSAEEEAVLRDWNCEDPPDDYEMNRNDDIEAFQGNRNPFIDRPDFVDQIDEF